MEPFHRKHHFTFNPDCNGGESFSITSEIGEECCCMYQTVALQSYGASATLEIPGWLTPQKLREFADELESFIVWANCKPVYEPCEDCPPSIQFN